MSRVETPARTIPRGPRRFNTFSSLKHRDFLLLWISNLCHACANWFQQITIPWVVWEISGSPLLVGVAAGMRSLPFLFVGPLAGVFADRVDRRKMVVAVQLVLSMVVLAFAFGVHRGVVTGDLGVAIALAFTAMTGLLNSLIQPVRQAMIANTVPRDELWNAIALNSVGGNIARVIGPGVGGVIIAWLGPAVNFLIEGVFHLLMVVAVIKIGLPYREEITAVRASVVANLKQGFHYVVTQQLVLRLLVVVCISDLFIAPIVHLMPVIADEVLGYGPKELGFLLLSMGVGGVIGTFTFATLGGAMRKGSFGFAALILLTLCAVSLGVSTWLWVSMVAMFGMGFFRLTFKINNNTHVQSTIPDTLRGRVMAIYHLDHGLTPLASMGIGLMAEFWDVNLVIVVAGSAALALSIWAFAAFSDVRQME